jgi:hypothetical protein
LLTGILTFEQNIKSLIAICLSILFTAGGLFPGTDVEDVYKVPILLKHYQEHKAAATKDGLDFSFIAYLKLHYGFSSEHAQTPHSDTNLPMYKHLSTGLTFIMPELFNISFVASPLSYFNKSCYIEGYFFLPVTSFLQPPRLSLGF